MRNSKVKGFTLIELIVVIAIIGVLAAILVPSMLGFVRNARISSANANAKLVHTASAAALTQASIDDLTLSDDDEPASEASGTITLATMNAVVFGEEELDLSDYLGDSFDGAGTCYFFANTFSVDYTLWQKDDDTQPDNIQLSSEAQENMARDEGDVLGCYPLSSDDAGDDGEEGE